MICLDILPHKKAATNQAPPSRQSPNVKRFKAREKLLESGYNVISRNGLDNSTLAAIIAEAGTGVGSFYKHFRTKEDLAKEIFKERTNATLELSARIIEARDPVAAVCLGYRHLIYTAEHDAVWGAFIVKLEPQMQLLDGLLRPQARVVLSRIARAGGLITDDIEMALTCVIATAVAMIRLMVMGEITSQQAHASVIYTLRMYGIPDETARDVASWPMEKLWAAL